MNGIFTSHMKNKKNHTVVNRYGFDAGALKFQLFHDWLCETVPFLKGEVHSKRKMVSIKAFSCTNLTR